MPGRLPATRRHPTRNLFTRLFAALVITFSLTLLSALGVPAAAAGPATFYVDCAAGDDGRSGTSRAQAWRTLSRANRAALQPGDRLLLKRGCTWTNDRLNASWAGTAAAPVVISAFGSGALPRIRNGESQNVNITGSHQLIEYLDVSSDPPAVFSDAHCAGQPIGWSIGFNFRAGAAFNTLRYSQASSHAAGARIDADAHHNRILHNVFSKNNVMTLFDRSNPAGDLGAWGVLVAGDDNEIGYNQLSHNNAVCRSGLNPTDKIAGNSIELFEARRNLIHHNTAVEDRVFSELGSSPSRRSEGNIYAYNLVISSRPISRFIVTRGAGDPVYGPVLQTIVYNNTVYLTGPSSHGVVCGQGCDASVLTLRNNIIWSEEKAAYADGAFKESNNLYWSSNGTPMVQLKGISMSDSSQIANPRFVNPAGNNFRLQSQSPAIDVGSLAALHAGFAIDIGDKAVPQGGAVDIGAYEYAIPLDQLNQRLFGPLAVQR